LRQPAGIETIADILPVQADRKPDGLALLEMDKPGRLRGATYGELAEKADACAALLREHGVGRASPVAIAMPNSSRWVLTYFGIHRAGAVAVPLDYAQLSAQPDRVRFALDHAEVEHVVTTGEGHDVVRDVAGPGRNVIQAEEMDAHAGGEAPPPPETQPDDLAQILYTSGTTGPRKGVELTHRNIIFDVAQCCRRIAVMPGDCLPAVLPYHHGYALTTTVVLPFYAGARMVVGDVRDRRFQQLMRQARPTVLIGVPRMFDAMLRAIERTAQRRGRGRRLRLTRSLSGLVKRLTGLNIGKLLFGSVHTAVFGGTQLRLCVSGGARVPVQLLRDYYLMGIPLLQGWGMTELSPVASIQELRPHRFHFTRHYERKAGSIGTPLDGSRVLLIGDAAEGRAAPGEESGEMVVQGEHVMRGYHKDAERTARQFTQEGLRTGDIARRDADGELYIVGRAKHVIVLPSGKKVFPEEDLDDDLSRCATIAEIAVRPVTDESGAERIGMVVRPNVEELKKAGVKTVRQLYDAVKRDIDAALRDKPGYLRRYDFCLTRWRDGDYAELVKSTMGDPSPLRNEFDRDTAYSRAGDSDEPAPFASDGP